MYKIKEEIPKYLFRQYDIRGRYNGGIDEDFAYTFGLSFGTYIKNNNSDKCIIAHDNRLSSQSLYNALIEGLINTGVDIISLGLTTTPMFYYAGIKLNVYPGIMITASHNPASDNGFKFSFDERGNARGQMIEDFYNFTEKKEFISGKGTITNYDIKNDYIELFDKSLDIKENKLKVVIDPGNGTTSIIAKDIYKRYINNLTCICNESDGSFPIHHPDPTVEDNLTCLKEEVKKQNADIGIAFDGDGDRVGIIDNNGKYLPTDKYMAIIIRDIINKVDNKTFLIDVKCSNLIKDEITSLGGKYVEYRTGNSYTKAKTKEIDSPFGGELSGHIYFRDRFPGFDSGLYAGLRLVEIMSKTNKNIDELLVGVNEYCSTPTLIIPTTEENKWKIVNEIKEYAINKNYNINDIDGVKVLYEDGFALVRASNTGPNLTLRFEAKTNEVLEQRKKEYMDLVNKFNVKN